MEDTTAALESHSPHLQRPNLALVQSVIANALGVNLNEVELKRFVVFSQDEGALRSLSNTMSTIHREISPALARAAQASENLQKSIGEEFGYLSTAEFSGVFTDERLSEPNLRLAGDMRRRGELMALKRHNRLHYQAFQVDLNERQIYPWVQKLLTVANDYNRSQAGVIYWLVSPSTYFAEQNRSIDHFREEPDWVINLARRS